MVGWVGLTGIKGRVWIDHASCEKRYKKKFMHAMSRKGVGNCFAISLWFRFAVQLETRLETCLQWLLRSLQLEELNNWSQCLRCCTQSVHVYRNCLERSQKHVAYNHYNYMETRLKWLGIMLQILNNYPWVVRMIGAIKRQFFSHVNTCSW